MTDGPDGYFLRGEKILLRGLQQEDMKSYRRWLDNADATFFMESGWKPTSDKDLDALYRVSTESDENAVFVIVDRETDRAMGTCGLYVIQWVCRRGEFRIFIGDTGFFDKGFGSEAARLVIAYGFEKLNLNTIYLGVNTENARAIKSYENAGFVREGVRRELIYRNGRYYDALMMSILRQEYFAG